MVTKAVRFRFYAELNDFLPPERRFTGFERTFELSPSVKDMIESLGVPHTEVDLIIVDGEPVDFTYRIQDGDEIAVYPVFESFDVSPTQRLRPEPLRATRFVLDGHLGRLAGYLRLVGFDTLYRNPIDDEELAAISVSERRILLTRDIGLLKRKAITHGYFVRATDPRAQLSEVLRRFDLARDVEPFTRCMNCNGELKPVAKEDIAHLLEPDTARFYDDFRRCEACERIYWEGSHHERLLQLIRSVAAEV